MKNSINVLLLGAGGREHALAEMLSRSPLLHRLFIAPGNPGTAQLGTNLPISPNDLTSLTHFICEKAIDLVISGPEIPLIAGVRDLCDKLGVLCIGPSKMAARLEGSKKFTKEICDITGIPTARWKAFTNPTEAVKYIYEVGCPIVIKADGLAAGKGVTVAETEAEAIFAIKTMMQDKSFGIAGETIIIEECLVGDEVSLFAFCNGDQAVLIGAAQDHKRIGNNDTGANTGGMGAISPPPGFGIDQQEKALDMLVRPMLKEMVRRSTPFNGVIFAGLMLTEHGPKLIEYNVRLGDPEAQALLIRLQSDLLPILVALAMGRLDQADIHFSNEASICVVLAARGYPGNPVKGSVIKGISQVASFPGIRVFQAATRLGENNDLYADGGRVLNICATANTLSCARERVYKAINYVNWQDAIWRNDIGLRSLQKSDSSH